MAFAAGVEGSCSPASKGRWLARRCSVGCCTTSRSIAARTGSAVRSGRGVRTRGSDRELAEQALAHAVGSQVEQCYARSDMLERRLEVMEAWGAFLVA